MNDFNFNEDTVNKLKSMMNNGDLSDIASQISPEMIENFSNLIGQNSNASKNLNDSSNSNFDFSNLDMNTIMKMKSVIDKMNSKNNPSMNLLYSLKPYLRDGKKEKLDQYANLMNFAQIAELFRNDNKENNNNE